MSGAATVRRASGLGVSEELRRLLARAAGRVGSVDESYGGAAEITFGDGDSLWVLGTEASPWRLVDSAADELVGSDAPDSAVELKKELEGTRVTALSVAAPSLDLVAELSGGRRLIVECQSPEPLTAAIPTPPHWEVFTPDNMVIAAGPGPYWAHYSADVPEAELALPHLLPSVTAISRDLQRIVEEHDQLVAVSRRSESLVTAIALLVAAASLVVFILQVGGVSFEGATVVAALTGLLAGAVALASGRWLRFGRDARDLDRPRAPR